MPPQQFQRLLDFGGDGGGLGAHVDPRVLLERTLAVRRLDASHSPSQAQHRRNHGD
jgi:hypothetical protein